MSEGNRYGVSGGIITSLTRQHFPERTEFKPCVIRTTDSVSYLNEDCSFFEEPIEGTNFSLLKKNDDTQKVIGVCITGMGKYI